MATITIAEQKHIMQRFRAGGYGAMVESETGSYVRFDDPLVMAAPELLAALKAMVASYDGLRDVLTSGIVKDKLTAADAVIAKVEGR